MYGAHRTMNRISSHKTLSGRYRAALGHLKPNDIMFADGDWVQYIYPYARFVLLEYYTDFKIHLDADIYEDLHDAIDDIVDIIRGRIQQLSTF